ncbi:uncharacterized protein isoform X4 [Choristoneura fumiferana]|uniref:uncharacterized protein isoform X4 n=1 Tax=Choristoneura fumiferana TaxID=7141 RepID=UPI003D159664
MDCCYVEEECEDYSVRPMLMVPCAPVKCRGEAPACFPCLPRCSKKVYCCEKPKSKPTVRSPAFSDEPDDDCCQPKKRSSRPRSSDDSYQSPQRQARCPPPPCYEPCCQPTCKPVKTKYVIPCYRYEDGRIVWPLPSSALKRNGLQDQDFKSGGVAFIRKCWHDAWCGDYPRAIPIKPMKKLPVKVVFKKR